MTDPTRPTSPDVLRVFRRLVLDIAGLEQKQIAEEAGASHGTVFLVLEQPRRSGEKHQAVLDVLGRHLGPTIMRRLWPEWEGASAPSACPRCAADLADLDPDLLATLPG